MNKKIFQFMLVSICAFILITTVKADPIKFARFPHISNGKIVFTYHGDIWMTNDDGSNPVQLTDHIARDEYPRFSPDGEWIAFSSNRMGNYDIWVMPVTGGEPRQLTFHTSNDNMLFWTPDDKRIIFSTSRGAMMWGSPLYTVSIEGGLPLPVEMGRGAAGMISQDGSMLAFNRVRYRHPKKNYLGSSAANIWIKNLEKNTFKKLTNIDLEEYKSHTHDAYPMWGADGMIYFMSERSGIFNIWKISPEGGEPIQVTYHRTDGVQFPSISPDGKTIVYSNEFELWKLSISGGSPEKITIEIPYKHEQNFLEFITSENRVDGFAPSPEGDYLVVDYHGEIFIVPSEEGIGEKKQITNSEWRERSGKYSPDGNYLAYLSDESGDDEVWIYEIETGGRKKLTKQASKKELQMWSPDSKQVLFTSNNSIYSIDVENSIITKLAYNEAGGFNLWQFSPDGKWLVYTRSDDYENSEIYLYNIEESKEYNVTQHPARETGGLLTPDQKTLVFTSNRGTGTNHLFALLLEGLKEDPDDPIVKKHKKKEAKKKEKKEEKPAPITINLEDIERRAVQLTKGEDAVRNYFLSQDGKTIYYTIGGSFERGGMPPRAQTTGSDRGSAGLYSIGIDGKNQKKITDGAFPGLTPTLDSKMIFYQQQNDIYKMDIARKKKEKVTFSFTIRVDKKKEWKQMFDEFYRHWKYSYVEEDMLGFDWDAIRKRYEPLVEYIGETQDFYDLAAEMLFELKSTHSGASPPRPAPPVPPLYRTRLPGFEMVPDGGKYKISHMYRKGPADKEWLDLKVGEYVHAIDGKELKAGENYWKILNNLLNEYTVVKVSPTPDADIDCREVRIKTELSLNNVKYDEWIEKNREFVDKETDGKIIYVHIRAMNQTSLGKFEQEIDQYFYKKGIIIDVRFNGGGNIDQQLMDILERKPYQYTWSKSGSPVWGRRPKQTIVGPKVMITNWRSNSDAEMTPHGFRHLGLGRLIGTPTNGAVVSARRYTLLDGGSTRIPGVRVVNYDLTKPYNFGYSLENYGVPPDIWIKNSPEDEIKGYDRVLKAAIDEVMRMLEEGKWQYESDR